MMEQSDAAQKKNMTRSVVGKEARGRAVGLLDMMYTPAELAEELGIKPTVLYCRLIPAGLPHSKDTTGHIWIHGPEVVRWLSASSKAQRQPMEADEAYCLRCRQAVKLIEPRRVKSGRVTLLKATCSTCGSTVNRGVKIR